MPIFQYEALDPSGQQHSGEINAENATAATAALADRSLVVLSLQLVRDAEPPKLTTSGSRDYEERINAVLSRPEKLIRLLEAIAAEPASSGLRTK